MRLSTTHPRPAADRLGAAHGAAFALAQAGAPPDAILEHLTAAIQAGVELAATAGASADARDLGGRVAAAGALLQEAGVLLELSRPTEAWAAVLRAVRALECPGGLSQQEASLRAAAFVDNQINAGQPAELFHHNVGVQAAAWDPAAGHWRVAVVAESTPRVWTLALVGGATPEVIDER